ncbi:MAG: phosphatase PAP2 family protein [Pirellulaceae bacterium]
MGENLDPSLPALPNPLPVWKRLLLPAVLAVLVVPAFWLDMSLSHFFATKPWGGDLAKMVMLCEAFGYAGTVAFILLAAALLDPRGWRVLLRLAIASYGAGLLADLIKLPIGRHRPLDEKFVAETALQTFTTWDAHQHIHLTQSFPSAHTATATGLACGLAYFYPRGKWLFIVLAMLTALQRMHAREHYLSDVFAGAAIGTLVGILTTSPLRTNRWLDSLENRSLIETSPDSR